MINHNFTAVIRHWLRQDPEDRDPAAGALCLFRIDGNEVRYRSRLRNPEASLPEIEEKLRAALAEREQYPTPEEKQQLIVQAEEIRQKTEGFKDNNPAAGFKAGKRPDHDTLPPEIRKLYVDNLDIRRRMQQYHLEIRMLIRKNTDCASKDLKILVGLLKNADVSYRRNWKEYDKYGRD